MPYISARVNCPVDQQTENTIKSALGEAITVLPGKSEHWLMCEIVPDCHLYFQGRADRKTAFVTVKLYGSAAKEKYDLLTGKITEILSSALHMSPDCIYVQYEECHVWGWNGDNF